MVIDFYGKNLEHKIMDILVIGSGGREHVLCWKLAQSKLADKIYCAPGNAGIAQIAECVDIDVLALDKLADFAQEKKIGLTVVGPEAPLCAGISDVFKARGLTVFGPSKAAAQLEGSKDFAKQFMLKYNIPTAAGAAFTDAASAMKYVSSQYAKGVQGIVVKADGLAAGKGVLVAESEKAANDFVMECFNGAFGTSGNRVVIEECLIGEEASILALTDGKSIRALVSSQDHKRVFDHDKGPNTGGMGAYSPAPVVTPEIMEVIDRDILQNVLRGLQVEELEFTGLLFVGVMVTANGPKVLEFNVRFGDPEVQAVLSRFDGDLVDVMLKVCHKELKQAELIWNPNPAVCVVIASGGYPEKYQKNYPISGLDEATKTGAVVFHAGTALKNGVVVNVGGRVLGVSATGKTLRNAIDLAYSAVDKIKFTDAFCRRDIGYRALARENVKDNK